MGDSGKDETLVHGYCYAPEGLEGNWLFIEAKNFSTIKDELDMSEDGDKWAVWPKTLRRHEVDALPEHKGW